MNDIDRIFLSILSRVKPGEKEKIKVRALADGIISRIDTIGNRDGLDINGILVGSSARGTWLAGEHDLDIFIMFPSSFTKDKLQEKGLAIAREIAKESDSWEERYAEHPYIHAVFNGFEVDLVPAFRVKSPADIKSAVDRTPFHNDYINSRIKGLEDDVLLLKQFMKAIGVYGSELRTRGFSGYLVELLIIHFGSLTRTIEEMCTWKNGMTIDIKEHGTLEHNDPLVVVDPTDPARNVAAALSLDNLCIFIDRCCEFLGSPDTSYFNLKSVEPLDDTGFRDILDKRGTSLLTIEFNSPDVVEDVLYPQLHKLEESARKMLERYDFHVYNSGVWADEKALVMFELESSELPYVKEHTGPAVWVKDHANTFKSKYRDSDTFSNVYIKNGKYVVDIQRKYPDAKKLMGSELSKCSLGKHVGLSIKKEYRILKDDDILDVRNEAFRRFLRRFFEK